jgi:HEAT repeat protein
MRRFILRSLLALFLVALVAAFSVRTSRDFALGLIRGEGFQDGWPASSWASDLKDPDVKKRVEAAKSLSIIGENARDAVPALAVALKDPEPAVRQQSAFALFKIGPEAAPAVQPLIELLDDPEPIVRMNAAMALARIGAAAAPAVPAVRAALRKPEHTEYVIMLNHTMRHELVHVLGCIGPGAKDAVPDLIDVMQHAPVVERWTALQALERILGEEEGNAQGLAALKASLKAPDALSRYYGIHTIREMELSGQEWTDVLAPLLKDDDANVRVHTAFYLQQLKYSPESLAPVFADGLLTQQDQRVRQNCLQALMQMGTAARGAVPVLAKMLKNDNAQLCIQAADLLGRIGPDAKEAVPALQNLLKDKRGADRRSVSAAAHDALSKIEAKPAKQTGL